MEIGFFSTFQFLICLECWWNLEFCSVIYTQDFAKLHSKTLVMDDVELQVLHKFYCITITLVALVLPIWIYLPCGLGYCASSDSLLFCWWEQSPKFLYRCHTKHVEDWIQGWNGQGFGAGMYLWNSLHVMGPCILVCWCFYQEWTDRWRESIYGHFLCHCWWHVNI